MNSTVDNNCGHLSHIRYCGAVLLCLLSATMLSNTMVGQPRQPDFAFSGIRYRIELDLDFRNATFLGVETVRFTNAGRDEMESVLFNLYPNVGLAEDEALWLSVSRVTFNGRELHFSSRSRQAVLKIDLPSKLASGQSMELRLEFSAHIPSVQREEASLLAHFLQEVNDAVSDERSVRDTRDVFFAGEEAMLLGSFYPILAARPSQLSEQSLVAGAGGILFSEAADYEVRVTADEGLTIIASAPEAERQPVVRPSSADASSGSNPHPRRTSVFRGERLRGFGLAVVERVKSLQQQVGGIRVVSYFREGDEKLGKRAMSIAAHALETYTQAFGNYPYPLLQIVEMPLPAGYSDTQLPGLIIMAQAYFIDFDAPRSARLPGVLREQADVIKTSFEFTLAHGVAHQWWGCVVGSDPERAPYLDEAIACYAAVYYHELAYGKPIGEIIIKQQLNGTYQAYRMLGGADQEVDKPARDFRNTLQFTAIAQAKGALLIAALRRELGDEKFFAALKSYYSTYSFRISTPEQFRGAFLNVAEDPRGVRTLFQRWLREKHGDEDIGAPDLTLLSPSVSKIRAFGRVFVKIGKTAVKPF
ncbi:MAG: M1 family aminopeptidase [Acidobacteriota bacterium]